MSSDALFSRHSKLYQKRFPQFTVPDQESGRWEKVKNPFHGEVDLLAKQGTLPSDLFGKVNIPVYLRHWLSKLSISNKEILVVYGLGMGYPYQALKGWLKGNEYRKVIFLEDDPDIIFHFFSEKIAQEFLNDPQAELYLIPEDSFEQQNLFNKLSKKFLFHHYLFTGIPSYQREKEGSFNLYKFLFDHSIYLQQISIGELLNLSKEYYTSFWGNLYKIKESMLFSKMKEGLKGIPAIAVGAGPSLGKQIPLLKKLKDKALIIAGGTAVNVLNANGIDPHLIIGIDPYEGSFLRTLSYTSFEVPLIYKLRYNRRAIESISSPLIYLDGGSMYDSEKWIESVMGIESIKIEMGTNVVNSSISLSDFLGCNPLITVGVDLAYTDEASYGPGIKSHAVQPDFFKTRSSNEEVFLRSDIYGKPVKTLMKWINESFWYSNYQISHPEKNLINATEGGIGFLRVPNEKLKTLSEEKLTKSVDILGKLHTLIQDAKMPKETALIQEAVEDMFESLKRLEKSFIALDKSDPKLFEIHDIAESKESKEVFESFIKDISNELAWKGVVEEFNRTYALFIEGFETNKQENEVVFKTIPGRLRFLQNVVLFNRWTLELNLKSSPLFKKEKEKVIVPTEDRKPVGDDNCYGKSGRLLASSRMENGIRDGKTTLWYDEGGVFADLNFCKGEYEGIQTYYFPDGSKKSLIPYSDGQLHGTVQIFWSDGTLRRELHYSHGKREGLDQFWNKNGILVLKADYKDDLPINSAFAYTEEGNLIKQVIYGENGSVIEVKETQPSGRPFQKIKSDEDYLDKVGKGTESIGASLEKVFSSLEETIKSLPQDKNEEGIQNDLKMIAEEMKKLKSLGDQLTSIRTSSNFEIEMGKVPKMKEEIKEQLEKASHEMRDLFQQIDFQVKDVRKKLKE